MSKASSRNPQLPDRLEVAVLVGLELPEEAGDLDASMDELGSLADAAGIDVKDRLIQRRTAIDPSYFIGKGKAGEVRQLADAVCADWVIADHDLTPGQQRNLEKVVGRSVMDRTELILRIFADHARSRQAKVQVELAQAEYQLPRLKRMWTHLHREKGGVGLRAGGGERQIEVDRRRLRKRITDLKRELKQYRDRAERTVQARRELFTIAIVGYTNAGKSTLMNALCGTDVLVKDQLFATLETRTSVWEILGHHRALLSDTVGFISRLPHHLVEAFHATLAEAMDADLLLHVVDVSAPSPEKHVTAVEEVLAQLGCADKPTLRVLNKVDMVADHPGILRAALNFFPEACAVSAHTGTGLEELRRRVSEVMSDREVEWQLTVPVSDGRTIAALNKDAEILEQSLDDGHIRYRVRIDPRHIKRIAGMVDTSPPGSRLQPTE